LKSYISQNKKRSYLGVFCDIKTGELEPISFYRIKSLNNLRNRIAKGEYEIMFPPKGEVMGKKPGFPMLLGQVVPGHHPPPSSLKFGLPIPTTIAFL